ncbi:MAG: hypothetical protein JSR62_01400 [Nitrospira sp.]|nr:hypothetical protein [Nitrospira sp.]
MRPTGNARLRIPIQYYLFAWAWRLERSQARRGITRFTSSRFTPFSRWTFHASTLLVHPQDNVSLSHSLA